MTSEPKTNTPSAVQPRGRNMAAVASGKGGVGKTWFAITLSHALAKSGTRTLLFDGDLGLANLDIQLGLMPKNDLGGVISGRMTLNQAIIPYPEGNFDIIAGRSGSGGLANVPASRLQILSDDLSVLAPNYDRVILDLGAGVEKTVRAFAHNAGSCLVLATDEPTLPIRLSPTPTICSVSPWTAGKGRRRRIEEAIRLILDCSENLTGV